MLLSADKIVGIPIPFRSFLGAIMKVIAAGVETAAQLEYLRRAGCDEMQGYLFSHPVSATAVETMVREDRRCGVLGA